MKLNDYDRTSLWRVADPGYSHITNHMGQKLAKLGLVECIRFSPQKIIWRITDAGIAVLKGKP